MLRQQCSRGYIAIPLATMGHLSKTYQPQIFARWVGTISGRSSGVSPLRFRRQVRHSRAPRSITPTKLAPLATIFLSFPAGWGTQRARLGRKKIKQGETGDESRTENEKPPQKEGKGVRPGMISQLGSQTHSWLLHTAKLPHLHILDSFFSTSYTSRHNT